MQGKAIRLTLTIMLSWFFTHGAYAAVSVAFVAIKNESQNPRLNELEFRIPVEVTKLVKQEIPDVKIIAPPQSAKILAGQKLEPQLVYKADELAKVCDLLKADALLSAVITLQPGGLVHIRARLYLREKLRLMQFDFTESPETILKSTVSGVVTAIGQYLQKEGRYFLQEVRPGTRVALYSNASPEALNRAAMVLMANGYSVSAAGYVDFLPPEARELALFRDINTPGLSFLSAEPDFTGLGKIKLSPLDNAKRKTQNAFNRYDLIIQNTVKFGERESAALQRFAKSVNADYLLIVNLVGELSFARGIDLKNERVTYLQRHNVPSKEPGTKEEVTLLGFINEIRQQPKLPDVSSVGEIANLRKADGGDDLASVAILDFTDRTNSVQFGWLQESLSSAVNDSMIRVFEYKRVEEQKEKSGAALLAVAAAPSKDQLFAFHEATGADYLIFGDYTFDPVTQELLIEAKVFDLFSLKQIGTASERSPIDGRMFNAVDSIAGKIIQDIYKMATEP